MFDRFYQSLTKNELLHNYLSETHQNTQNTYLEEHFGTTTTVLYYKDYNL